MTKHKNDQCNVYVITNLINGKQYVGITNNLALRFRHHSYKDGILATEMREYGKENFKIEVLFQGLRNECKSVEIQKIAELGTNIEDGGYNVHEGGSVPPHYKGEKHHLFGKKQSPETIAKIKAKRALQMPSEKQREAARKRLSDPLQNPRSRARLIREGHINAY